MWEFTELCIVNVSGGQLLWQIDGVGISTGQLTQQWLTANTTYFWVGDGSPKIKRN